MTNYDFDNQQVGEQLDVPALRKPRNLAWSRVFTAPIQYLWEKFMDWKDGYEYPAFNGLAVYQRGDRITYTDNVTYERIYQDPNFPVSGQPPDGFPQYWQVVNDNFIGAVERRKYNGQIIMLEYALNRWFRNPLPANQIYIVNNVTNSNFWVGNTGAYSSTVPNLSQYSTSYVANANTVNQYDFTVMVPSALYTSLGPDANTREKRVRKFVDKYKISGISYDIQTY
jgi:hypothetical protein